MKRSSIDIGSNTTLLLIGEVVEGRIDEIVSGERVTALGKDLDRTKRFCLQSMQDTLDALKDYRNIIENHGLEPGETLVTATEAARIATNAKDFFEEIEKKWGFRVCVITAEGEAYYTLRGVIQNDVYSSCVIMDIGGASTELIKVSDGSLESVASLPVGSVRASDWRREGCLEKRLKGILVDERFGLASFQTDHLVGVGGTMTSLAAISQNMRDFECGEIEGCQMTYRDLKNCLERMETQPEEWLQQNFPFLGKRVKSIKEGGRLAIEVGELLGIKGWVISTRGLRHGTLKEGWIDTRFTI